LAIDGGTEEVEVLLFLFYLSCWGRTK